MADRAAKLSELGHEKILDGPNGRTHSDGAKAHISTFRIDMDSPMKGASPTTRVLSKSQAACLTVLRNPGFSQRRIAGAAKLDLKRTEAALRKLAELGLASRSDSKLWSATKIGETCDFESVADPRVNRGRPAKPSSLWPTNG